MTPGVGRWIPCALGLALTGFTLGLHLLPSMNSMLNLDAESWPLGDRSLNMDYLSYNVEVHRTEPAFARRPCTTWIIDAVDAATGIGAARAFIATQFVLLFVSGLSLYRCARRLGSGPRPALLALVAYHLSFTVLSGWFPPIYTYDEPLQYTLLFGALVACHQRRWLVFALLFTAALCVRESSLLLLPSLFLFGSDGAWRPRTWGTWAGAAKAFAFVLPVLLYGLFVLWYTHHLGAAERMTEDLAGRTSFFEQNFGDAERTWETLIYLYLAVGLPATLLFGMGPLSGPQREELAVFRRSFLLALLLNTVVVLVSTKAREARLFALPLLFAWPLLGSLLNERWERMVDLPAIRAMMRRWDYVLVFAFALGLLFLIVDRGWKLSDGNASGNLWHEYFLVQSAILLTILLGRHWRSSSTGVLPP